MKSKYHLLTVLFLFPQFLFASHNLGARIEAHHLSNSISDFTYEIKITTYTKISGHSIDADRPSLDSVHVGIGQPRVFVRVLIIDLPNDIRENTYSSVVTYPGFGNYLIFFIDPNRSPGISNIPISSSQPFAVEMELVIDPNYYSCVQNSAVFNSIPVFRSPAGKDFIANISAFDPDQDSLSYQLVACHGQLNLPIPGYFIPPGVSINSYSGEFKWTGNTSSSVGLYSFAVSVNKWFQGMYVGNVIEDFSLMLEVPTDTTYGFLNTSLYPMDTNGFFVSSVLPTTAFNLQVKYYDSSSTPSVMFFSEIADSSTLTNNINGHINTIDFAWTPSILNVRTEPYVLIFRGEPGEQDLTYLIYVNGADTNSCHSLISVPEVTFNESNVHVFPNPAHDKLNIKIDTKINKAIKINLTDVTGKTVFNKISYSTDIDIRINNFSTGFYILKIESDESVYSKKILVY